MNKVVPILLLLLTSNIFSQSSKILLGIDVLQNSGFEVLKGKKVGLITNPTGVNSHLKSTIDIFFEEQNFKLAALFGPEHGIRGDFYAGDQVDTYTDPVTNLPVYSLYGNSRKPSIDMLNDLDVLVYDIQDIGSRSYTYISTMGLAMEAAAENNLDFIVLDRPNPLGGLKVEGNIVEDGYFSFVSQFKIPYVYGLTCGELAKYLNEEGLLENGIRCKLTIVPMQNWKREMMFEDTGLQWILTSPHIPNDRSPQYYAAAGILGELGIISEGVGFTLPFQVFAAEWIDPNKLADKMNALNLNGVIFRPITIKPYYGKNKDKTLHGVQIHITDPKSVNLISLQFLFSQVNNKLYPQHNPFLMASQNRIIMFDKVMGSSKVRELFMERMRYEDIHDYLEKDIEKFKAVSKKYHLY